MPPPKETDRRPVPVGSGAFACAGFSWERLLELLGPALVEALPELRRRNVIWVARARINGVRIEFYDDEETFRRRLADHSANLSEGPQIHAGRLTVL